MAVDVQLELGWKTALRDEFAKPYFLNLVQFVKQEVQRGKIIYPPGPMIFKAFELTPFDKVKVVILGQDPYHGQGQAHGLCFSVPSGLAFPPSLQNIFTELSTDLGISAPNHGDLSQWAKQGVLLINAVLTVQSGMAGSHQGKGWEQFTDAVIQVLNEQKDHLVFLLWGTYARNKGRLINRSRHLVLECGHPSPLSANRGHWFGNRHFSQCNHYLANHNLSPINWNLS